MSFDDPDRKSKQFFDRASMSSIANTSILNDNNPQVDEIRREIEEKKKEIGKTESEINKLNAQKSNIESNSLLSKTKIRGGDYNIIMYNGWMVKMFF